MADDSSTGSPQRGSSVRGIPPLRELSICCWPLRDSLAGGMALLGIMILTGGFFLLTGQLWMSLFVLLVLVICTWRIWIPVHFEFGASGITRTCLGRRQQIPWYLVARAERCRDGIRLYPRFQQASMARLHAVHIYSTPQAQLLHQLVDKYLAKPQGHAAEEA